MRSIDRPADGLKPYYADLHVHLGWAGEPGRCVKIAAARNLTLANILKECRERKGIQIIGVIDAATEGALADLQRLMARGVVAEQPGGGLAYLGEGEPVTLIPGAEVEVIHPGSGRPVHLLCYLPGLRELRELAAWLRERVKNPALSTQRLQGTTAAAVTAFVGELGGVLVPAHIFTPYKATLSAAATVAEVIPPELWRYVPAVELGLSADTALADQLPELSRFTFLTNSDAHSTDRIAREYNVLHLEAPTFAELVRALREEGGRRVAANYGLDPRLGKYHRSYCSACRRRLEGDPPVLACPVDPAHPLVPGVLDRIALYRERQAGVDRKPRQRPPYIHQVPLQFVPGLGPRTISRLLARFGTEMGVLHRADPAELAEEVGPRLAALVVAAREGRLALEAGGGGVYGKVLGET
ncbi:MAG TPA: endonuclease Q family protein [Symbiobacteriaceae bacterium]